MPATPSSSGWALLKARLSELDPAALLALVHDLYGASKDNQFLLHARFGIGGDVLAPYKATLSRWLSPDVYRNQTPSLAKAGKAIADYKKAKAGPAGLAELTVFYCERASGFSAEVGMNDEAYLGALVRMFEQALQAIAALPADQRPEFLSRLDIVRRRGESIGYGVTDDMNQLWAHHGRDR